MSEPVRQTWIEVEDTYLNNRPLIWSGRGKGRKQIPDPDGEATEAWMFCWRCKRTKRGISRSRYLETLRAPSEAALDRAIVEFCEGKIVIANPEEPPRYQVSNAEPRAIMESA